MPVFKWYLLVGCLSLFGAAGDASLNQSFTDARDGRVYSTVHVGPLVWMAQNLAFDAGVGSWCYGGREGACDDYGRLYEWQVALSACPEGWELPGRNDWQALVTTLSPNPAAELRSGGGSAFDVPMAGYKHHDGEFRNEGLLAAFWTSTPISENHAWEIMVPADRENVILDGYNTTGALSVRCVNRP